MLRKNQRTRNRQSPRHKPSIKIVQQESQTVLHLATLGRCEALVSMLIKKGLDVNAKGHDGETALLQAAKIGHVAIAQLLRGRR